MKIFKLLPFMFFASAVQADDNVAWMCLFEHVPVSVVEPASLIGDRKLKVTISNDLGFSLSKVAVDFMLTSGEGETRFEQNIAFPFPAQLQPSETRELIAYLTISDDVLTGLNNDDLTARAATANVLDQNEKRIVLRENLGPAFQVFWPFQPKSDQACE